jgi:hypothetical protein
MLRPTIALIALIALGAPPAATAAPEASVISVSQRPGDSYLVVVVAIPKAVENAAVIGNADFGLRLVSTYVSENGGVETVDSGRVPITATTLVAELDRNTVAVSLQVPLGTHSAPSTTGPGYSTTAELLHPGSGS